jgi:hypothetical protein
MNITSHITEELRDHVNELCAKSKAWAEAAPEGEFRMYSSYDEEDMISHSKHYTKGERSLTLTSGIRPKLGKSTMTLIRRHMEFALVGIIGQTKPLQSGNIFHLSVMLRPAPNTTASRKKRKQKNHTCMSLLLNFKMASAFNI